MRIRGPLATLAAVAAAGIGMVTTNVVLAAQPAAAPAAVGYQGRSAGGEVTVALRIEGDRAWAQVGDGAGIASRLQGELRDGRMQLTGADGASLDATADGRAAFGTARAAGKSWPFSAAARPDAPVPAPSGTPTQAPTTDGAGSTGEGGY